MVKALNQEGKFAHFIPLQLSLKSFVNADVSTFFRLLCFESVVDFQLSGFGILVKMELT